MSFHIPKLTAAALLLLTVMGTHHAQAQTNGDEDEGDRSEASPDPSAGGEANPDSIRSFTPTDKTAPISTATGKPTAPSKSPPTGTMNASTTSSVVASLNASTSYCSKIAANEYMIDCLAERLEEVNRQIEGLDGYEEVSQVLAKTAESLNQIARDNRSTTLPPAYYSTPGASPNSASIATDRRLIAVDEKKLEDAMAQALNVIQDAETTLLLRSSEESADRAVQFQRIASAIGSNKVLLRS